MGCFVNGPGEALMTDVGFTGGGAGRGMVYLAGKKSHAMTNEQMIEHIVEQVEKKAAEAVEPKAVEPKKTEAAKPAAEPAKETIQRLQTDLHDFQRQCAVERVIVVNVASTEPAADAVDRDQGDGIAAPVLTSRERLSAVIGRGQPRFGPEV